MSLYSPQNTENDPKIEEAEEAIRLSDEHVEKAFEQLKGKLDDTVKTATLFSNALKDPFLLSATAFLVGIYLGESVLRPRNLRSMH